MKFEGRPGTQKNRGLEAGWWFGTCFIYHNIWDVIFFPLANMFQDGYSTTNQYS
jgi:hypothetical protein